MSQIDLIRVLLITFMIPARLAIFMTILMPEIAKISGSR